MTDLAQTAPIAGFATAVANIDGVGIHYRRGGEPGGPPVLLWHGFLGTSYTWRKVAPALADAGLDVLVPDMRGYGDSDKPSGIVGYDGRALAEEFRALVGRIGFGAGRPITLVAHDMGAPPALLWAAEHPAEIAGLLYMEEPVMLSEVLTKIISYTPASTVAGSLWWWLLSLAPNAPERLVVGNERAFLTWFFDRDPTTVRAIEPAAVDEYLRTFSGTQGVLGAMGVYRAAFTTMEQTAPLVHNKVRVPVVALGGERAQGNRVREMVAMVAETVDGGAVAGCAHFLPEESPDEIVRHILAQHSIRAVREGAEQ
jgi:pimeloyl-ACP methyl ester carboxylesterase